MKYIKKCRKNRVRKEKHFELEFSSDYLINAKDLFVKKEEIGKKKIN